MFITDSQVHLYLPDSDERPWLAAFRGTSHEKPEFLPKTLLDLMGENGVSRAVIVPPIFAGLDNGPCLAWAQEYPTRFGIMGRYDFTDPNHERLETWLDQPGMIGIRLSGPGNWLDPEEFGWFWAAVERLDIPVMIFVNRERIRGIGPIAERYPDARLILDHLLVTTGNLAEIDPWGFLDDTLALAKYPRVYGKLSALPLNTMEAFPYPSQTPFVRRAYDAFGPQRLAWGSDGSRLQRSTYKECVDHMLHTVDFLTEEDKTWIMGRTIAQALNWPEPS